MNVTGCYDGCLYILEALTGNTFWKFQTGAEVKSSPCVDPTNGHVYFGSHDHSLYALDVLVIEFFNFVRQREEIMNEKRLIE